MDLGAFLADDTLGGSWADEEVDMSSISVPTNQTSGAPNVSSYLRQENSDFERKDRVEHPVPNVPPYRARVANLPYDAEEAALARFFEDRLQARDVVSDVKLPMDNLSGKIKGFAFVTFTEKAVLEEALNLTMSEFNGRKIFVNVAAPQKTDVFDLDWRSSRSGPIGHNRRDRDRDREPGEQVELDWGAARSSSGPSNRERFERGDRPDCGDRPERRFRDEPELDWGSARSSGPLGPRDGPKERKPRREEPDIDWGSARGGAGPLPHKERKPKREEPEIDWSAARSGASLPPRERSTKNNIGDAAVNGGAKKSGDKEFNWKRGQKLPTREKHAAKKEEKKDEKKEEKKEQNKPQKSSFDVLALDDDEPDEKSEEETGLEKPVAGMSF